MARPAGRKVRDSEEAQELLQRWSGSNEALSSWCGKEGINWYSLVAFQRWPARRDAPKRQDPFVEVETTALVPVTPSTARVPAGATRVNYRVVVGDVAVEVDRDFEDEVLRRLLRVVATC